jgi:hypothetical protein
LVVPWQGKGLLVRLVDQSKKRSTLPFLDYRYGEKKETAKRKWAAAAAAASIHVHHDHDHSKSKDKPSAFPRANSANGAASAACDEDNKSPMGRQNSIGEDTTIMVGGNAMSVSGNNTDVFDFVDNNNVSSLQIKFSDSSKSAADDTLGSPLKTHENSRRSGAYGASPGAASSTGVASAGTPLKTVSSFYPGRSFQSLVESLELPLEPTKVACHARKLFRELDVRTMFQPVQQKLLYEEQVDSQFEDLSAQLHTLDAKLDTVLSKLSELQTSSYPAGSTAVSEQAKGSLLVPANSLDDIF